MLKTILLLVLTIWAVNTHDVYDSIIIGAGVSGMRASQVFDENDIWHIVLESSDHIGGRVQSMDFAGQKVNRGGCFMHNATKGNPMAQHAHKHKVTMVPATASYKQIFYQEYKKGPIPKYQAVSSRKMYDEMVAKIKARFDKGRDVSVKYAYEEILKEYEWEWPFKRLLASWFFINLQYIDGTRLDELSSQNVMWFQTQNDVFPLPTFSYLTDKIFEKQKKNVKLGHKVTEIDYSGKVVKITTTKGVFYAKYVVSSLPLGILKAGDVTFKPALPRPYQKAINEIGWATADKLYVTFKKKFWNEFDVWLSFITRDNKFNRYPAALVYPSKQNMLAFYVSGAESHTIGSWTDQQVKLDLENYLDQFGSVVGSPVVEKVKLTRWHKDPNSKGSFSFYKVGNNGEEFELLAKPINDKVWFVGEHTQIELNYYVQGAYLSGERAAKQIVNMF